MAFALDLLKGVQSVIDAEPTAYYPDRVVEQLKKEKEKGHYDSDSVIGEKNVWEKASDIVRKGGIDGKEEKQA